MGNQPSLTQQPRFPPCRRSSLKRKQELNSSYSDQQNVKKMRYIDPDTPLPSIEPESYQEPDLIFDNDLDSIPVFIDKGVIVGFWYADESGNEKRPVYCFVKEDFSFAYRKGDSFILIRDDDFDLLDELGDWLCEETEDENAMSPEEVKLWAEMMWESRIYAGTQEMMLEY